MDRLQITTLAAQDISAALLVATYTATAVKELLINLHLSGLAGSGAYRACLTRQIAGAGAVYQSPTSVATVSAGVTTVLLNTTPLAVNATDVVKVYAQGLAGDVAVGVVTEVFDVTAATAADVWDVAVPGGYPVGDAGYILGHLDGLDVTCVSPVLDDETIELYEGDSYYEADGRSLKWTDSGATWPNITGATVALLIRAPNGDQLSAAGVVSIGGGGAGQQVYVELSAAQTTAMVDWPKPSHFRLRVTLVGGHVVTLAAGTMTVIYDIA